MRGTSRIVAAAAVLAATLVVITPAPATLGSAPGWTTFSGVVQDRDGTPFAGVQVTLIDSAYNRAVVNTGADGSYSLSVAPGSYTLLLDDPSGHDGTSIGNLPDGFDVTIWNVQLTSDRVETITLPTLQLSVLVRGPGGNPVPDTAVSPSSLDSPITVFPGGSGWAYYWIPGANTDANGIARFHILPSQSFTISATPPPETGLAPTLLTGQSALVDTTIVIGGPPPDTVPPTVVLPQSFSVDATGPGGAVASYTATAKDDVDPNPTVVCTPPPGSLFAIGTTTVNCTATDNSGNSSSGSFTVSVKGASEQLADLASAVKGVGPGKSLADTVAVARWFVAHRQPAAACVTLTAFNLEVRAQSGKKIPKAQAAALIADANRIMRVLGCTK